MFIVDTSRAMRGMKDSLAEAIGALVHGGLEGWMRNGDSFGIWTFADRLATDYPMKVWQERERQTYAVQAAKHVAKQDFDKRGHLKNIMPHMFSVIGTVKDVTIVILSDGDDSVAGTEYDPAIKTALGKVKTDLRRQSKPAIIALVARDGKVVRWGVNSPEVFVPLPKAPPRPPAVAPALAQVTNTLPSVTNSVPVVKPGALTAVATNQPPAGQSAATFSPPASSQAAPLADVRPPPKVASQRAPIIMTRETVNSKTWLEPLDGSPVAALGPASAAPTDPPAPPPPVAVAPASTNQPATPPALALPSPAPLETNTPTAVATNAPATVISAPNPPPPGTGQPVVATAPPGVSHASDPAPPRSGAMPATIPPSPAAAQPDSTLPGTILIALGAMCTGVALGLFFMRRQASRHQPSLITRSMTQSRAQVLPARKTTPVVTPPAASLPAPSPQS